MLLSLDDAYCMNLKINCIYLKNPAELFLKRCILWQMLDFAQNGGRIYFPERFHRFYQLIKFNELVYQVSHFYPNVQI